MSTIDEAQRLRKLALELNAEMPTDVMLKGDGTIWITKHGNDGLAPRRATQTEIMTLLYKAINFSNVMISV